MARKTPHPGIKLYDAGYVEMKCKEAEARGLGKSQIMEGYGCHAMESRVHHEKTVSRNRKVMPRNKH